MRPSHSLRQLIRIDATTYYSIVLCMVCIPVMQAKFVNVVLKFTISSCGTTKNTADRDSGINIREFSSEDVLSGGVGREERDGGAHELEALARQEKQAAVNESLMKLQTGLSEAKVSANILCFSLTLVCVCVCVCVA